MGNYVRHSDSGDIKSTDLASVDPELLEFGKRSCSDLFERSTEYDVLLERKGIFELLGPKKTSNSELLRKILVPVILKPENFDDYP
ncbi:unnamed protein product [Protopolystoma xenopodis]|uniref:Uncharacterized protein n=1 Tax=Protopolystoma xenopodis TaxID=117903 RepID=A0A448WPW7_9PLAT|nr:unnamed protein product [Protopolystoma xenopodis]